MCYILSNLTIVLFSYLLSDFLIRGLPFLKNLSARKQSFLVIILTVILIPVSIVIITSQLGYLLVLTWVFWVPLTFAFLIAQGLIRKRTNWSAGRRTLVIVLLTAILIPVILYLSVPFHTMKQEACRPTLKIEVPRK